MKVSRETVYGKCFELIKALPGVVTVGRRARNWADVPCAEQPAVFQQQTREIASSETRGIDTKWVLLLDLIVYTNCGEDPNATPSVQMNAVLDAIEAAFPKGPNPQTLGGLVHEARINGEIQTDEGALGPQAVAIVPIRIVTT